MESAASLTKSGTDAAPRTSSSPTFSPDTISTPASPSSPSSPLTDTQLLQLSLSNAVSAVAAGKATVAANNYALVVKIFFRKCFLLEELVLLALAMGYETRRSAQMGEGSKNRMDEDSERNNAQQMQQGFLPSVKVDAVDRRGSQTEAQRDGHNVDASTRSHVATQQQQQQQQHQEALVDPLASVGMLLPPGLDEDDYDEERHYYEQKQEREAAAAHTHTAPPKQQQQQQLAGSVGFSTRGRSEVRQGEEDVPGYDAATARWLACLLAKVHPDALPIATLEKLCKVSIPSRTSSGVVGGGGGCGMLAAGSFSSPTSALRGSSNNNNSNRGNNSGFPSTASATDAMGCGSGGTAAASSVFSPNSANAIARLIPHLKSSPTSSLGCSAGSPTSSRLFNNNNTNANGRTPTSGPGDARTVLGSSSLSLLFATLLWDVACALWNEGFIEDTHHWLSVMDVRRLWKLYGDSCAVGPSRTPPSAHAGSPADSHTPLSPLFSGGEPSEEDVDSDERACALSWAAVLAECRAADAPTSLPASRGGSHVQLNASSTTAAVQHVDGRSQTTSKARSEKEEEAVEASKRLTRPRSGITLSAFGHAAGPLPMTSAASSATHADPFLVDVSTDDSSSTQDTAVLHNRGQREDEREGLDSLDGGTVFPTSPAADANAANVGDRPPSTSIFVRRLARRTSALRDLCGLMMGCETAEDVFYVVYALHNALEAQARKTQQLQQLQQQQQQQQGSTAEAERPASSATPSGGLAEVLIVVNLLVEYFLAKRAQKILYDAGVLPTHLAPATAGEAHSGRGVQTTAHRSEHAHRVDRAIRQACDEVVSAFTDGQCMTLYGLESYGIPTPHDHSSEGGVQLLTTELPYVLVSNVLSSTLNFSTLYRLSKVFQAVMSTHNGGWHTAAETTERPQQEAGVGGGAAAQRRQAESCTSPPRTHALVHPNRTRKATEEERLRRRRWTRAPSSKATAPAPQASRTLLPSTAAAAAASTQGVVGELFGFMKGAAAGLRNVASFVNPMSVEAETQMDTPPVSATSSRATHPTTTTTTHAQYQDMRPFRMEANVRAERVSSASAPSSDQRSGSYAARLAEARRAHAAAVAAGNAPPHEPTPWSSWSPNTATSNNANLVEATTRAKRAPEVRTSGPGACELLLPSHPTSATSSAATAAGAAAAAANVSAGCGSGFSISLLAEENERVGVRQRTQLPAQAFPSTSPTSTETETSCQAVLHTVSAQLQSRTPNEAACLRLLTLLYRYPQLHTLEPVTASHVDLVAHELNKALHILQVAMKARFGESWWLQWRARREAETQRYYARALADAQRGGHVLSTPSSAFASRVRGGTANNAAPPPTHSAVRSSSSSNTANAAAAAVVAARPPSMVGTTAVQPDPSLLLLRPPMSNDSLRPTSQPDLFIDSTQLHQPPSTASKQNQNPMADYTPVPPPSAPLPTPRQDLVLSELWNTRTLSIPTQAGMRERRENLRGHSADASTREDGDAAALSNVSAAETAKHSADEASMMVEDGGMMDVDWDTPPAYTPDVSLDFSAFTTTSVETQEATRLLVETLQRRQHEADEMNAHVPGVSLLSPACRRLLHNALPLLQQYSPWRVIYSTRMHGVSLSTLFANCRREGDRHMRQPNGLFSLPMPTESTSVGGGAGVSSTDARPMLLVLELPASTTLQFAEDDAGVREAQRELREGLTVEKASKVSAATTTAQDRSELMAYNKLYIGAYLSDLLRLESRRYYGSQECFVFQLLVPAEKTSSGLATESVPQLRVFPASRHNTQFINCRLTSIVIGGGGGGSSVYLDNSLSHGATSACATFDSPPLSTWQTTAATLCDVAGVRPPAATEADVASGYQHSLCVLNAEVIVMDA